MNWNAMAKNLYHLALLGAAIYLQTHPEYQAALPLLMAAAQASPPPVVK